jgi:TolA protein
MAHAPSRPRGAARASAVPESAQTLGRYKLQRKIGSGAMGVVYEALDPKLNRPVAIKTIIKSHLDEEVSREYSVRFKEEAQAVARLNHPNIVQVYDFGEEGEVAFIVMEFIRGKDLKQCFDGNLRFEPREFVRMMCELLSALDYAHQSGIVHRDIKPANVMLDVQSRVKLMDFGVAKITDTDRTHRTQLGTMVGTPSYMSPEQVQGLVVDHRSDLFSSGIVLYQFLTGQRPFTGGDWTLRKMIVNEDPVRPSQINTALSPEFDRVIARALAKAPESRYQSAADFGRALQRVFEGRPAEEEDDRTVMRPTGASVPQPSRPADPRATSTQPSLATSPTGGSQEVEVEFWRSIKDSEDAEDFELYLQQFPRGAYAKLAERKIAKLRKSGTLTGTGSGVQTGTGSPGYTASDTSAEADELRKLEDEHRRQAEELARRQAEARKKAEAEARARREAEEKARREAEEKARREAEERARREAEERARREAEEKARREAEAREKARREAEERARLEAERIRRENEERARREAEEKARREAEEKARREAEARAKREAEEKARREAEEKAKREAESKARREAEEKARLEAERIRRENEEKARLEAEAKARREAEEKARVEAERIRRENEEKARREAETKAKREAEAKAKREAEEKARQEAEARARARHDELEQKRAAEQRAPATEEDLTVAVPVQKAPARPAEPVREELTVTVPIPVQNVPPQRRNPFIVPGVLGGVIVVGAVAAYFAMRSPEQPPVVAKPVPPVARVEPQPAPQPQVDEKAQRESAAKAEQARKQEAARLAAEEEAKKKEAAKLAEEENKKEAARLAAEKKEAARLAEAKKKEEAARLAAAEAKKKEAAAAAKAAEEAKKKEEATRLAAEETKKKEAAAAAKAAEEARKKEEAARLAAEEAKRKEAAAKAAEEQKRQQVAAVTAKPPAEPKRVNGAELFARASELESQGKVAEAVKLYIAAANADHGPSAKKLGDIFSGGKGDVAQDYTASLRWHQRARQLGEKVQTQRGR